VILALNKIDLVEKKDELLPALQMFAQKFPFAEIFPLSALRGHNLDDLEKSIAKFLPENPHFFAEDQVTDRSQRFLAAELVREKIMRQLGEELPYEITVEVESFKLLGKMLEIHALIMVEREGQKKIVIGNGGDRIKLIGEEARKDMEIMFERKVMLKLWVKVKAGWSDDERALRSLGYTDYE
jgi:GTP-binding protein Era